MYKLKLSFAAKRQLKNFPKKYRHLINNALYDIKEGPRLNKRLERELTGRYAYKLGFYRIIYTVNSKDKKIIIMAIDHRGVVYKKRN